jgi:hypothetical protein
MVDFNGDGNFDEIDAAILEEEESKQKEPESNKNEGCFLMLFAVVAAISLVAWSITHYVI